MDERVHDIKPPYMHGSYIGLHLSIEVKKQH